MTTYTDHKAPTGLEAYLGYADRAGLDHRLAIMACHEARARYIAALEESEAFCITLYMSKHETQARLREATRLRFEESAR